MILATRLEKSIHYPEQLWLYWHFQDVHASKKIPSYWWMCYFTIPLFGLLSYQIDLYWLKVAAAKTIRDLSASILPRNEPSSLKVKQRKEWIFLFCFNQIISAWNLLRENKFYFNDLAQWHVALSVESEGYGSNLTTVKPLHGRPPTDWKSH